MVKTAQRKKKYSEGRINSLVALREMTPEIAAPLPEKKWCEPKARTRTKELLDLLYRAVRSDVVVRVNFY
jgi:hypothetical protein